MRERVFAVIAVAVAVVVAAIARAGAITGGTYDSENWWATWA